MRVTKFANSPFPNFLYTFPIDFQWGMLAIISLKSSGLKASKGRREIRDTNPFLLIFRVRHFVWRARISKGERGRRLVTSEKLNFYIFVLLWLKSTRHLLPHNVTEDSVFVIHHLVLFYFSLLLCFRAYYLYLCLAASHVKQNDSAILWNIQKWINSLIY